MGIKVVYNDGDKYALEINDEEYHFEDEDTVIVPITAILSQDINEFPDDCRIEICESMSDNMVVTHNVPTYISKIIDGKYAVEFSECITRKYWDAPVGLKLYMETKKEIIEERAKELKDVQLTGYDDDGAYINITYSSVLIADSFQELFDCIDQLFNEIEGATDIALGSPFEKIENCRKEDDFTTKIILPLLRKLGFSNVRYNHGNAEFGKDITFSRRTEFDEYEFWGMQVKFGDVSGGAMGEINELINQAKDAFTMPFYDVYTRQKTRISKLVITISGKYSKNAVEKIIEGINDFPLKNNIVFLDGEKINTLIEKYRRF